MLKIVDNRRQYLSEHPEMSRIFGLSRGCCQPEKGQLRLLLLSFLPTYRVLMISQEQT